MFVKKVYHDGHSKNKNYSFKQALMDASKMKKQGKMSSSSSMKSRRSSKKTTKRGGKRRSGTRKHRRH